MEVYASGMGLLEGPVVCQDGSLVVTSISLGKLFRIRDGKPEVLCDTQGGANGSTEAADGTIYVAQNGGLNNISDTRTKAGVQAVDRDGKLSWFGEGMVAPNDICFGPDGYLYVTDPSRKPERDDGRIWRCDIRTRECTLLMTCDWYPNGIGFNFEDEAAYVADSRHSRIMRIPLNSFTDAAAEVYFDFDHGTPDGFAFDMTGDLICACPDFGEGGGDVQVYRDGKYVRSIDPGPSKLYTNLAISPDRKLYLCDSDNGDLLVMDWPHAGLPLHPFRHTAVSATPLREAAAG